MDRRYFIKSSTLLAAASNFSFTRNIVGQSLPLGLQLFSIRNYVNKDFENTMSKVAQIGYEFVESAGYNKEKHTIHGQFPKVFRDTLNANNLKPISAHAAFSLAEADAALDDFATLGVKYLVCPSPRGEFRKTLEGYYKAADELNAIGKKAKERGILFGYHNHDFEFTKIDEQIPYDVLLKNTDPDLVFFQIDLGWMVKAGYNPVNYFKKNPGRFPLWHVRDINEANVPETVGNGKVDFLEIFSNKKQAGLKCGIVETQVSQLEGLLIVENSFKYLQKNKLY